MGSNTSKNDNEYIKIVEKLDNIICGWITPEECQTFLNTNSLLIKNNFYKIVIKNPKLITNLIKVYPQSRKSFLDILGKEEFRFLSTELEINNL
jgi:hypothetical protein